LIKKHTNSFNIRPELYKPFYNELIDYISKRLLNTITDSFFGPLWIRNTIRNIKFLNKIFSINNISNSPVIIVGSGYSAELIKKIKNIKDFIIITIPQTLKLFEKYNIKPDIVVIVDAGYPNRLYKSKIDSPLISYIYSSYEFIKSYKGEVFFINSESPIDKVLLENFPIIPVGGSVASTCFEIASLISDTIIVLGFDFSIINGYYHYRGCQPEENLLYNSNKIKTSEKTLYEIIYKGIKVKDNIYTNTQMISYKEEFLRRVRKSKKRVYRIFPDSLEEIDYIDINDLELKQKRIIIESKKINQSIQREIIEKIQSVYEEKNLNNTILNTHIKRWLLKKNNQEIENEIQKVLKKIKMLKN